MTGTTPPSIWAALEEAVATLPEPFSRAALLRWVEKRRPDVETSSISTHIHYAIAETPNRGSHALGRREPLLERVDRGLYRRYRGAGGRTATSATVPAGTATAPRPASSAPSRSTVDVPPTQVVLVGCSSRKAPDPMPARELFRGGSFQKARDRAVLMGVPWFVLSAKYGLLDPDDVVGPYDVFLGDQPSAYRRAWGEWVAAQLGVRLPLAGVTVEVHAGDAYCAPLRGPLQRLGATLSEPLAGLSQGKRLAWSGYREGPDAAEPGDRPDLDLLLDAAAAVTPDEFVRAGAEGRRTPGLYVWWVDEDGARQLSEGMGHPIEAGLLYAGKAGGHRVTAEPSTSTLWSRIAGNHLRGNVGSSTFRRSLAALLTPAGGSVTEDALTAWMHAHLRVAVLPVTSELVPELEDELVARADPPLNLAGAPQHPARSALTRLRGLLSRPTEPEQAEPSRPEPARSEPPVPPSEAAVAAAFEHRVRRDIAAMVAAGYRPSLFQRMIAESGAVGTARRLLASPTLSDGFQYLWEHGLLRHSIEHAVLDEQFAALFSDVERAVARQRLRDAGYR